MAFDKPTVMLINFKPTNILNNLPQRLKYSFYFKFRRVKKDIKKIFSLYNFDLANSCHKWCEW